uniref:PH domain-containing protein n=1 Tax=Steinernema glaseri TaxID=37863 RepID=A0A1I8ALT8_9BILA
MRALVIRFCLKFGEQNLDAAAQSRRNDLTQVPELGEYLKYLKPKKLGLKNYKRGYFTFRDLHLTYYQTNDLRSAPLGHFSLKGCEVTPDISVNQQKYQIKLLVPSAEGMSDFIIRCDTEHQYAKWMSACKLASRGKSMADSSYQ